MRQSRWAMILVAAGIGFGSGLAHSAELLLPANRSAYFAHEAIEIAVTGLAKGQTAAVELTPMKPGAMTVKFAVTGDGSTVLVSLPPRSLTPNEYTIKLDGKE